MITPSRRKRDSLLPLIQFAVDCLTSLALLSFVFWFRFSSGFFQSTLGQPDYPVYHTTFSFIILILVLFLRTYGLYNPAKIFTFAAETTKVFKAVAATTLILTAITFFIRGFSFSRTFLVSAGIVLAVGISLARFLLGIVVMEIDRRRGSFRNILMIGCDENARKLVTYYSSNPRFSTRVTGFLDDKLPVGTSFENVPVLGRVDELPTYTKFHREIHEVVLSAQDVSNDKVLKFIYECEKEMVTFRWIADIFGLITSKMRVSYFGGVPILSFADSPLGDWENRLLKRGMDVFLSAAGLLVLSPVFAAIAAWVRLDSPGPVFYKQERIGEDGRHFMLLKFRTMRQDAESASGPVWTSEADPRRTRAGAFLRKNNLDELPQLWNVLIGDMSLVGPRPERPFFVSQFREDIPRYMARHMIRSGITGWAQVNGLRGNTSIEERTKLDLYYIENWSLFFDVKIIVITLMRFFASPNAY